MLNAGAETTSAVLEWAMTNLLKYPNVLEKARSEIDEKIGNDHLIDEPALANLPYLQKVVNETSQLFPVAPLLIPRATLKSIKIGSYDIPKDTIVMVNAWAIQRDPENWENLESFEPDRFNGTESVHKLIPFGNGRRIVTLALGSLIQCYDWEKVKGEEIDMEVTSGLTMKKVVHLGLRVGIRLLWINF